MRLRGADGRDWHLVATYSQRWEAEMIRGFLESNEVPVWLVANDASGAAHPGVPMTGFRLMVREDDVETAQALIASGLDDVAEPPDPGPAR